jgi:hypothetical protein
MLGRFAEYIGAQLHFGTIQLLSKLGAKLAKLRMSKRERFKTRILWSRENRVLTASLVA